MGYHVVIETDTTSGEPVDDDRADQAGGRLAPLCPSFLASTHDPQVTVTLYVEGDDVGDVLRSGVEAALRAFESVGEPLTLRSASLYTEAEFERVFLSDAVS
ncbi:hypothetical protein [Micromonospora inositola]|uniref:Uncharacterized protein n=1 Tax=Micromonospora inositola TaxID=47865 RepID=A0A1C5JH10_9ACTN|nr:hypothetical protein [Micromonospora inositola]SCG69778.1 hypothetical protein GA0070613_4665 [Micromonospora inositola]